MSEMIVQVRNKILRRIGGVNHFVSHNKDYTIQFQFDESWDNVRTKMAVFAYEDGEYGSEIFDGDTCNVPELPREGRILIGVKAGEDLSTELLCIPVCKSADDVITDEYDEPDPKIYEQILDIINNLWNGGTTVYPSPVKFLASPSAAKVGDLIRVKEVDENGDVTRTEGFDVGVELEKKINAPQVAQVGEVLTVEEVGEDGKPKKWKTQMIDAGYDTILAAIDQAVFDKQLLVDILAGTCENLTGDAITAIADYVFYKKQSLKTVDLPNCISIGLQAFNSCAALVTVDLPMVTSIEAAAFQSCTSLTTVNLPNCISIATNAFNTCERLDTINLPKVTTITRQMFYGCKLLASVNIPMATSIEDSGFAATALTSANFPMVKTIGNMAFQSCGSLATVNLPMVTEIGAQAFRSCNSLKTVQLPMVKSLTRQTFYSCYTLTALVLSGTNVCALISTNVFTKCYHILGTTDSIYNPTGAKDGYIYVPDDLVDSYKSATNWTTYASQIKPLSEFAGVA